MIRRPPRSTLFPYTDALPIFFLLEEEFCCCVNICANLPLFCIWDTTTAWLDEQCVGLRDRKSTRLNSSHANISYAVFCLKKKKPISHIQQSSIALQARPDTAT